MSDQINGLPANPIRIDGVPMHNFSDPSTWPSPTDSTFTMQPPAGEAWVLNAVRIRYSVDANFQSPLIVSYYMHGVPVPVRQTVYKDTDDFIDRCDVFGIFPIAGEGAYTKNIFTFEYHFDEPLILWGTCPEAVPDPANTPRMSHFTMKVADDMPVHNDQGDPVEMVKVRYPGVVMYDISSML